MIDQRHTTAWIGVLLLAACSGGSEPPPAGALVAARATPSGDGQSGPAGEALEDQLRVLVTRDGVPESGVTVTWATTGAGASMTPGSSVSDAQGIATSTWTVRQVVGATTATATVAGAAGSPVGFTATVVAGPASQMDIAGGSNQTGEPGEQLDLPLLVEVTDEFGNAVAGVSVDWQVTLGGGSVTPQNSTTDANGATGTQFTLGPAEGPQAAQGIAAGLAGSPAIFNATAAVAVPGTGVVVSNNEFTPAVRTVPAGTTVVWTWTNTGAESHSVRSTGTPSFPSSAILTGSGSTYSHQFNTPGTYTYDCEVHGAAMTGSIVVQ